MPENQEIVDYRWGDKYRPQEFIQKDSYEIQQKANSFTITGDKLVEEIAAFVRDDFVYPLIGNQPSCDGQFARFKVSFLGNYRFKKCVFYMWSFPSETLSLFHAGICIDTATLAVSLLRAKGIPAWCCLGEVRKASSDELLGYHAWSEISYKDETYLGEHTIHQKQANTLAIASKAYDKSSEFARKADIYYLLHAKCNESEYIGVTELGKSGIIFTLMGKPQKFLKKYGLERTLKLNPKAIYKQWKRDEVAKQKKILDAWRETDGRNIRGDKKSTGVRI